MALMVTSCATTVDVLCHGGDLMYYSDVDILYH